MPPGTLISDYLDAIRYRRYTRSVLVERRRFLVLAVTSGTDAWFMSAPADEVVARVCARSRIRSKTSLRKLRIAIEDYRRWRRRREAPATAGDEPRAEASS